MTDPTRDPGSSVDSTRDVLAEWNIQDDSESNSSTRPHFTRDRARVSNPASSRQPAKGGWESGHSIELLAGFALDAPDIAEVSPGEGPSTVDPAAPLGPAGPDRGVAGATGASSQRPRDGLPRPGDELAGFRIILELGRGAFARVYLAEEINLGRRLVAIKVSKPDGDEPQILARLQHTHIVPVHSVCDDPSSGLRVLCMPYFGGADLARVLKAAGGLVPTRHDGGSLVNALDQISRSLPEYSGSASNHRAMRPLRSLQSAPGSPASPPALRLSRVVAAPRAASRFHWLLARLVRPGAASPVARGASAPDQEEPSRLFLRGASAIEAAVWIVARLAEALDHSHARGLLHRDLKPSNILLAADGTPMLLDFNLAVVHPTGSPEGEIRRALVGGTLPYMSPEHLDAFNPRGHTREDAVDERSDIYALGLILFEMLAGDAPFPDPPPGIPILETIEHMIACRRRPPSLRARCPQVPWSLDALTGQCLAFDPARRYVHARALAEDLRRFLECLPMKHCPEPSIRERMGKWARRHPGLCGSTSIALFSVVLIGLLGGAVALVYDKMQGLDARLRYRVFDQDFTEIQFLLNTTVGSNEHLKKGIEKASQTLAPFSGETPVPAGRGDWVERLTLGERHRLRDQVVELIMLDARARVLLARQSGEEDRRQAIGRAIARLDHAERIAPAPPSALFTERARYHTALGETEFAQRDRLRSLEIAPSTCHDLTLLATSLLSAGDRRRAEETVKQALRLDVKSIWAWFVLGHCHYAQGRFIEAAGDFAACAVCEPKFAWVHFNRGLALARAGRPLEARYAYDRALELDPTFAEALVNRAMVELELDQPDVAQRDLLRSQELGRDDLVALAALGETWARMGRRAEAERYFAGLLARNADSLIVRIARGFTRIATDPTGARSDLSVALGQDPRHAHALYGMALLARGTDLRKALGYLDRALESDPNLIDAQQLRAIVRARLGDRAALDDVERLLESPTPHHLYNAACAVAIYSDKAQYPQLIPHALELLDRALASGFPASEAAADPDLKPLHQSPEFKRLVTRPARQ